MGFGRMRTEMHVLQVASHQDERMHARVRNPEPDSVSNTGSARRSLPVFGVVEIQLLNLVNSALYKMHVGAIGKQGRLHPQVHVPGYDGSIISLLMCPRSHDQLVML